MKPTKTDQPQSLELTKPSESAVARPLTSVDMGALLEAAVKQGSAMEVIKELRQMEAELQARRAKAAFDAALSAFQSECPVILKEKAVPDRNNRTAYKYAPIESIEIQIKPFEQSHGFSHNFPTTTAEPGWVSATCKIMHCDGHSESAIVRYPIGTKTLIMSDTQQYAAAETFCKRRALCNAYGLTLAGEDLDGATGKLKPQGPSAVQPTNNKLKELVTELWRLLKPVRGTQQNWDEANQWLWREEILDGAIPEAMPDLSEKRMREVIEKSKQLLGT